MCVIVNIEMYVCMGIRMSRQNILNGLHDAINRNTSLQVKFITHVVLPGNTPVGGTDNQYRTRYNAVVSDADLHQTFLPAFKAGVQDAGVRSVRVYSCCLRPCNSLFS